MSQLTGQRFLLGFSLLLFIYLSQATAGTIYKSSLASSSNEFWKYDTSADSWTRLRDHHLGSNIAVSASGDVYAYSGNRQFIEKYDASTDTWSNFLATPVLGGSYTSTQYNFFNLEITNEGRFLLTGNSLSTLYYSDGGAWSGVSLGFGGNAMGDYDPTTGQYALTPYAGTSPKLIDTQTFAQTSFAGTGGGSDWRRSGSILDNKYYSQTGSNLMEIWDLLNPGIGPALVSNGGLGWMATAADRDNHLLYAHDIAGSAFRVWDGAQWTVLASTNQSGNHTTLAYVGNSAIPEPTPLALLGLGLAGIGYRRHTQRKTA